MRTCNYRRIPQALPVHIWGLAWDAVARDRAAAKESRAPETFVQTAPIRFQTTASKPSALARLLIAVLPPRWLPCLVSYLGLWISSSSILLVALKLFARFLRTPLCRCDCEQKEVCSPISRKASAVGSIPPMSPSARSHPMPFKKLYDYITPAMMAPGGPPVAYEADRAPVPERTEVTLIDRTKASHTTDETSDTRAYDRQHPVCGPQKYVLEPPE